MHLIKMASKWMSKTSPLGLFLVGTAVVASTPMIKDVLRGAAVTATRGVLKISEGATTLGAEVKENWEDIVAEAKSQKAITMPMADAAGSVIGAGLGGAVGASIGSSMAGPVGASVGGGVGSVVGAGVGKPFNETQKNEKQVQVESTDNHFEESTKDTSK